MARQTSSDISFAHANIPLLLLLNWEKWVDRAKRRRASMQTAGAFFGINLIAWIVGAVAVWLVLLAAWAIFAIVTFRKWSLLRRMDYVNLGKAVPTIWGMEWLGLAAMGSKEVWLVTRVRKQWRTFCLAKGLYMDSRVLGFSKKKPSEIKKYEPYLSDLRINPDGDVEFDIAPGQMMISLTAIRDESEFFIRSIRGLKKFVLTPKGAGGEAHVCIRFTDPLEHSLLLQDLPMATVGRTAFGLADNGKVASLNPDKSTLFAGVPGSGKTRAILSVVADWIRTGEYVDLYVIDPARGADLGYFKRLATIKDCSVQVKGFVETVGVPSDPKTKRQATAGFALCEEVIARMEERAIKNGDIDMVDWSKDPVSRHVPTKDEPRIVVICDELMHVASLIKKAGGDQSPAALIMSVGRKYAISMICATQDATKENAPIRDMFGLFVGFKTASATQTGLILGNTAHELGAKCEDIPEGMPGVGYMWDPEPEGQPALLHFRAAYTSNDVMRDYIQYGNVPPEMPTKIVQEKTAMPECAVYRIYGYPNDEGLRTLLYIGESLHPAPWIDRKGHKHEGRLDQHLKEQPWADEIDVDYYYSNQTWSWCKDKDEALVVEERLIRSKHPKYNKEHGGGSLTKRWSSVPEDENLPAEVEKSRWPMLSFRRKNKETDDITEPDVIEGEVVEVDRSNVIAIRKPVPQEYLRAAEVNRAIAQYSGKVTPSGSGYKVTIEKKADVG